MQKFKNIAFFLFFSILPFAKSASVRQTNTQLPHLIDQDEASVVVNNQTFIPSISMQDINDRIKALGKQITQDYQGTLPLVIGVLKGAVFFFTDLTREITIPIEMDFLKISSYNGTRSSGKIQMVDGLSSSVTNRDVIIVEDIIDSGLSMIFLRNFINQQNPKSLRIATLLKKDHVKLDFPIDYVGFEISPDFVVGYGLDFDQKGRNLKAIYKLAS